MMQPSENFASFLREVRLSTTADVHVDDPQCVVASTDNSIWQIQPQAVIAPRCKKDVQLLFHILSKPDYHSISMTPRGGGTSTSGQTLTKSIVLDVRRYLHQVLDYDSSTMQVTVESGAVLFAVNSYLKKFGVKIGPTVATANRATIGGMIGNDSAGKGSLVYGKMSDCVINLEIVQANGDVLNTAKLEDEVLVLKVKKICDDARPYFKDNWPELPRFLSGYNLPMTWDGEKFDLNKLLCGAEGTLGVVVNATLQCVELQEFSSLIVAGFSSFNDALRTGALISETKPIAIETVDEHVVERARNDASWSTVSAFLGSPQYNSQSFLFIEYDTHNQDGLHQAIDIVEQHALHIELLTEPQLIEQAWQFRSRAVGLLSASLTKEQPVPFVEDCAVPPERLADFINSFKVLLGRHDLQAGMFGHVDAGVIHVRPALDLEQESNRALIDVVMQEVFELVRSFDGIIWGEHGKGLRSSFCKETFGEDIWRSMCNIKKLFDPTNQLNPRKVASPNPDDNMSSIETPMRGEFDAISTKLPQLLDTFRCDGNGECQSVDINSPMCPTYRATNDPVHSPRGRSELLRYWQRGGGLDYIEDGVRESLDGCLSCRACATGCPMQVDIPTMRTTFYESYYKTHSRPIRDYAWFNFEKLLPLLATPLGTLIPLRLISGLIGISDPPAISRPTLKSQLKRKGVSISTIDEIKQNSPDVVLLLDPFTTFFRPQVILAFISIFNHLEISFAILPIHETGKAHHVRGDVKTFTKIAIQNMKLLTSIGESVKSIVGIDPATTLLWRDEYFHTTKSEPAIAVQLPQEWLLTQNLSSFNLNQSWRLFPHCIESSMATKSSNQWCEVFNMVGSKIEIIRTSCCGMGGLFGHQQEFQSQSKKIWELHWQPHDPTECDSMATGYSCYSQALRFEKTTLKHPLEVFANSIS